MDGVLFLYAARVLIFGLEYFVTEATVIWDASIVNKMPYQIQKNTSSSLFSAGSNPIKLYSAYLHPLGVIYGIFPIYVEIYSQNLAIIINQSNMDL